MLRSRLLLLFLLSVPFLSAEDEAQPLELIKPRAEIAGRSTDSSESVIVEGSENAIRARILSIAMDIREETYRLMGLNENTQEFTVKINLHGEVGEDAPKVLSKKSFSIVAGTLFLTLDLHLSKGVNEKLLERDLTELFLYEIGMQQVNLKGEDDLSFRIPLWLSTGVLESIRWKKDKVDRQLYARLYKQQSIYPMEELLAEESLDEGEGMMNHAFQVSSGVLVMALLNQPQGKEGLYSLLKEAPSYEGEPKLLISKHFPDTTLSKNSLAKWWSLQLITMSQRPAENLYSIAETEKELTKILSIEITDKEGIHVVEPRDYLELKNYSLLAASTEGTRVINQLSLLQSKCFPAYRELIGGYQQVLIRVIKAPEKKRFWHFFTKDDEDKMSVSEMLVRVEQERAILARLGERITDYLNWYQLERADNQAGAFDDYLQLKNTLEKASPSDGGHISQYLDDIELMFQRD